MAAGALGVLAFSLTLPATRAADPAFGAVVVGVSRAVPAAAVALVILALRGEPLLTPRPLVGPLLSVVGGVVVGFPLCTAAALMDVDSAHGAVVTGLIPAATAGAAVLVAGERPGRRYWAVLGAGLAAVGAFALVQGAGRIRAGDAFLLLAVVVAGIGYARGGALARTVGGWRVICWALVLALPVTVPVTVVALALRPPRHVTAVAGLGFG